MKENMKGFEEEREKRTTEYTESAKRELPLSKKR